MRYRSRYDIVRDILSVVAGSPQSKTKIMYQAYLSYKELVMYLKWLLDQGVLSEKNGPSHSEYALTPKGTDLLASLKRIAVLLPE